MKVHRHNDFVATFLTGVERGQCLKWALRVNDGLTTISGKLLTKRSTEKNEMPMAIPSDAGGPVQVLEDPSKAKNGN